MLDIIIREKIVLTREINENNNGTFFFFFFNVCVN